MEYNARDVVDFSTMECHESTAVKCIVGAVESSRDADNAIMFVWKANSAHCIVIFMKVHLLQWILMQWGAVQ